MHVAGFLQRLNGPLPTVRNGSPCPPPGGIAAYLPAALLLFAGLAWLTAAWSLSSSGSGRYLVIAPLGASRAQSINLIRAGDGGLVRMGLFSNIIIAGSNRPNFAATLHKAGAWGVIPVPLGDGCGEASRGGQTI